MFLHGGHLPKKIKPCPSSNLVEVFVEIHNRYDNVSYHEHYINTINYFCDEHSSILGLKNPKDS
jgi:hypothetical protein